MTPASARSFDSYAEVYERFALLWGGAIHDHLRRELPAHAGRAVDLGCGTGRHAAFLAERCEHVLGVDVSVPMLDIARRTRPHPAITYQQRDLREVTPERDGRFDVVFSAYTLHHLPDLDAALRGIRRLVAPGGHVVLLDAVGWLPRLPAWYFRQEAARLLAANLLLRRLPRGGAVDFYRVSTHPLWLAHCTGDRFLTRRQFRDRYRTVFPGGRIDTFRRTRALHWQAPSTPDADPAR